MASEKWQCPVCTLFNLPNDMQCDACGQPKVVVVPGSVVANTGSAAVAPVGIAPPLPPGPPPPMPSSSFAPAPGSTPAPLPPPPAPAPVVAPRPPASTGQLPIGAPPVAARGQRWTCHNCTLVNDADTLLCEVCDEPRPGVTAVAPAAPAVAPAAAPPALAVPPLVPVVVAARPLLDPAATALPALQPAQPPSYAATAPAIGGAVFPGADVKRARCDAGNPTPPRELSWVDFRAPVALACRSPGAVV